MFLGDTPAASLVGGFKEGVGGAFKCCRTCMIKFSSVVFSGEGQYILLLRIHIITVCGRTVWQTLKTITHNKCTHTHTHTHTGTWYIHTHNK